jgi:replicative superfamily II helicase
LLITESEVPTLKQFSEKFPYGVVGGTSTTPGKVNLLIQAHFQNMHIGDASLAMDMRFVAENAQRLAAALFQIALSREFSPTALTILRVRIALERQLDPESHPLTDPRLGLPREIANKIEYMGARADIDEMMQMDNNELGDLVHHHRMGERIARALDNLPQVTMDVHTAPLTRKVLRVNITVTPSFTWYDRIHEATEPFWIWVEDSNSIRILYSQYIILAKKKMADPIEINCTIPLTDPLPAQIFVRAVSDRWLGIDNYLPVSFQHLILPDMNTPETRLLNLRPLSVSALQNDVLETVYSSKFNYFNPLQTQVFHVMYHTNQNVLLGAPTGSGKTVAAELAMWYEISFTHLMIGVSSSLAQMRRWCTLHL